MSTKQAMSREFKRKLHREVYLRVQEIHDGCSECQHLSRRRHMRTFCNEHRKEVMELCINPKKHIKIEVKDS